MRSEETKALVLYRMDRSTESIRAAEIMFEKGMLTISMNRIYYSMFYAVQALLAIQGSSFSKHGQVKGYFNRHFIKTGIFPMEMGKLYNKAFEYRQNSIMWILPSLKVKWFPSILKRPGCFTRNSESIFRCAKGLSNNFYILLFKFRLHLAVLFPELSKTAFCCSPDFWTGYRMDKIKKAGGAVGGVMHPYAKPVTDKKI